MQLDIVKTPLAFPMIPPTLDLSASDLTFT